MKSLANEFDASMAIGAEAHHQSHAEAYDSLVHGIKNEADLAEQVHLVEQMVAQGMQAIVIAPVDSKALIPVLKRAADQGVLIVNIDNKLDADSMRQAGLFVPFVGPDYRAGAKAVGLALAEKLLVGNPVAIIEGLPAVFNDQQRRAGFENAMREAGMKVVSIQSGNGEVDQAKAVVSAILSEHPGLKAILCANDTMALGASAAIQSAGKQGQVLLAGFGNINAVRPLLTEGKLAVTADPQAGQWAVVAIEAALEMLAEKKAPQDVETAVEVILSVF